MPGSNCVALLRGINVGGRNRVPMADLRALLAESGYGDVRTYIQSGNVLLATDRVRDSIEPHLESVLEEGFGFPIPVLVRSETQMRNVVRHAPDGFGATPDRYHSDVVFLKAPLTAKRLLQALTPRDGVDVAWAGTGVLYFQRLSSRRAQSRLSRVSALPEYSLLSIRNWNTTTKLVQLLDGHDQ